jgi:type 1 glutamine amidotransferase
MPKKALIVYGGWSGHEPQATSELWAGELRRAGLEVELSDSLARFDREESLRDLALIVPNWTMGELTPEREKNLVAAVEGGVGLGGFHGGMGDAFRASPAYQFAVGGQFVAHPDNHKDHTIQITNPNDPITKGLKDFSLHSEQYYMHTDPRNEVLATTTFEAQSAPWINGAIMPAVWRRRHGRGRVFYASWGHNAKVFDAPEAREIVRRGLLWASGSL